jgi:hypothetical protein
MMNMIEGWMSSTIGVYGDGNSHREKGNVHTKQWMRRSSWGNDETTNVANRRNNA